MLEVAERRASMCQAYYCTFHIRERYIIPVSSNFLTQISCGIKTKCRKTRAMQRDFTIVDSLALRQCNTSMIPDTHLLKLLFLARYYLSLNLLVSDAKAFVWLTPILSLFARGTSFQSVTILANFAWKQDETAVKFVRW